MYEGYAKQYRTSCVVIEEGNKPDEVIEFAEEVEAKTYEGEHEVFVVQFPGRPGPECYSERALRSSMKNRRTGMILVQFCPCGCTSYMSREELIAASAGRQLEQIEAGTKLDAPVQPSERCPQCQEDRRMQDERTARFLADWPSPLVEN